MPLPPLPATGEQALPPHRRGRPTSSGGLRQPNRSMRHKASIVATLAVRKLAQSPMATRSIAHSTRHSSMIQLPASTMHQTRDLAMRPTGFPLGSSHGPVVSGAALPNQPSVLARSATFLSPPRRDTVSAMGHPGIHRSFDAISPAAAAAGMTHYGHASGIRPMAKSHPSVLDPLPLAPVFEHHSCWSRMACCTVSCGCCGCCDSGCLRLSLYVLAAIALVAGHGMLLLVPAELHVRAASQPTGQLSSACVSTLDSWWTAMSALGMATAATGAAATAVYALGSTRYIPLAAAMAVAYSSWAWVGVAWTASAVTRPGSDACAGEDATAMFSAAFVLGSFSAAALAAWLIWHRFTRRTDSNMTCKGCCYLGACIMPCTYVEATRIVTACFCCSCQVATDLPPPVGPGHVTRLARTQFVHAEACLPCAGQVTDPERLSVRTYGGQGGIRALRQLEQRQLDSINRARAGAGLELLPPKKPPTRRSNQIQGATPSRARLTDPARAMRAAAADTAALQPHSEHV
jgi:hypothetical protein